MRAAVVRAPGDLELRQGEPPEPGPAQVRVRLEGCGVCASDLPVWEGRPWFDYPLAPGCPGHEGWGVVDAVGADVKHVKPGVRVAAFSTASYADYDLAEYDQIAELPATLADKPFPGEPLACAMNAFSRCRISEGADVAIVGAGFQGLLLTQLAHNAGARVVVFSRRVSALRLAEQMGADAVVRMDDHNRALQQGHELAKGDGYDVVIESAGAQWPLDFAGELCRVRGRLVVVGYHQDPRQVNMQLWNWRGLDVINAHERDMAIYIDGLKRAIAAVEGRQLDPWPLLTHQFPLDEAAAALDAARERPDGFLKAIVVPA